MDVVATSVIDGHRGRQGVRFRNFLVQPARPRSRLVRGRPRSGGEPLGVYFASSPAVGLAAVSAAAVAPPSLGACVFMGSALAR